MFTVKLCSLLNYVQCDVRLCTHCVVLPCCTLCAVGLLHTLFCVALLHIVWCCLVAHIVWCCLVAPAYIRWDISKYATKKNVRLQTVALSREI
jgi:hypothetical protein